MLKIIISGCNGHMGRVDGIAFQGRLIGKGGVQHQVRIGRAGQRIGVNVHFQQPRDLPGQPFQPGLNARLNSDLFGLGHVFQLPQNNVTYHYLFSSQIGCLSCHSPYSFFSNRSRL